MLTQDKNTVIQAPFPPEALSSDTSRGFALTSIKALFVIERLNQVFRPCGIGWRYVPTQTRVRRCPTLFLVTALQTCRRSAAGLKRRSLWLRRGRIGVELRPERVLQSLNGCGKSCALLRLIS